MVATEAVDDNCTLRRDGERPGLFRRGEQKRKCTDTESQYISHLSAFLRFRWCPGSLSAPDFRPRLRMLRSRGGRSASREKKGDLAVVFLPRGLIERIGAEVIFPYFSRIMARTSGLTEKFFVQPFTSRFQKSQGVFQIYLKIIRHEFAFVERTILESGIFQSLCMVSSLSGSIRSTLNPSSCSRAGPIRS